MSTGERHLSTREVAERLGVSRRTLRRWERAGRVRCTKLGPKSWRWCWAEVAAALGLQEEGQAHASAR